jgi:mRNA-degrading endonuclease toxin of MazEF toxin-antitoxin module
MSHPIEPIVTPPYDYGLYAAAIEGIRLNDGHWPSVALITSNANLADAPGNVLLPVGSTGLPRESVVNVSQLLTLDRGFLTEQLGALPPRLQGSVDSGLRTVLQLQLKTGGIKNPRV